MYNLKSSEPNEQGPKDDDTLTVFFPATDFEGNVYIEKVEGPKAGVIAGLRPIEESPLLMGVLNELQPQVRDCLWRHIVLQQSLKVIASEIGMPIEDVKSNIIAGAKHVQKRMGRDR
jgi:DNA-directed RNA polymerase specialized sigma24 family protein